MDSRLILVVAVVTGCLMVTVKGAVPFPRMSHHNSTDNSTSNSNSTSFVFIPTQPLSASFGRDACGESKLCVETPLNCDPATSGACLFVSAALSHSRSGTDITFELRGESRGYIALLLSPDSQQGDDHAFICAPLNSSVHLITAFFTNSSLTPTSMPVVDSAQGSVTGDVIRCIFTARGLNATASMARSADTSFFIFVANGTFNNGELGSPTIKLTSNSSLDLTNASSNANPTNSTGPTGSSSTFTHPSFQAVLVLLCTVILRLF